MFFRSENLLTFVPSLESVITHIALYIQTTTNNSPSGVLTTGGQTPQTGSLSGSIDLHKMINNIFGAELVGCI